MPSKDHLAAQSTTNRQGRGNLINGKQADEILNILKKDAEKTYENYELMLNERFDGSTINENNKHYVLYCIKVLRSACKVLRV